MALVLGTNCGFVTTAPTADPADGALGMDGFALVTKDTTPSDVTRITEMGWYLDSYAGGGGSVNYEIGIYAADGGVVPGEAGTLLYSDTTNATGTSAGWKTATGLNWAIDPSTAYWLSVQIDSSTGTINIARNVSAGSGYDFLSASTLPNPFGGGALNDSNAVFGVYAVVAGDSSGPANLKTYNTNPVANTKTINTNPIANVKSLNTNV